MNPASPPELAPALVAPPAWLLLELEEPLLAELLFPLLVVPPPAEIALALTMALLAGLAEPVPALALA
jgi:hypothetical protein